MLPGDTAELRKARGAFFTPPEVARFVTSWAVRNDGDAVIEPSCGEAVFLHEAPQHKGPLVGVELHEASAREAERTLRARGIPASIHVGDFFDHQEFGQYDAAVGNPPYVRYQGWTGEARSASRAAALRAGVSLTKLASSWAAFTVHAALHLKAGGRLGLVLPAELLTVNYAAPVRRFLLEHFSEVSLMGGRPPERHAGHHEARGVLTVNVGELRELLADLPDEALVLSSGVSANWPSAWSFSGNGVGPSNPLSFGWCRRSRRGRP